MKEENINFRENNEKFLEKLLELKNELKNYDFQIDLISNKSQKNAVNFLQNLEKNLASFEILSDNRGFNNNYYEKCNIKSLKYFNNFIYILLNNK